MDCCRFPYDIVFCATYQLVNIDDGKTKEIVAAEFSTNFGLCISRRFDVLEVHITNSDIGTFMLALNGVTGKILNAFKAPVEMLDHVASQVETRPLLPRSPQHVQRLFFLCDEQGGIVRLSTFPSFQVMCFKSLFPTMKAIFNLRQSRREETFRKILFLIIAFRKPVASVG